MKSSLKRCARCGCVICTCHEWNCLVENNKRTVRPAQAPPVHKMTVQNSASVPVYISSPQEKSNPPKQATEIQKEVLVEVFEENYEEAYEETPEIANEYMEQAPIQSTDEPEINADIIEIPQQPHPRPPDEQLPEIIIHRNLGEIGPSGYGLAAWTFSPMLAGGVFGLEPGRLYIVRLCISSRILASGICVGISEGGCGLLKRQTGVGIYNERGMAVAYTVDQSGFWERGGVLSMELARRELLDPGNYDVILLCNGTLGPKLFTGADSPMVSLGLSGKKAPYSASMSADYIELPAMFSQPRVPLEHSIWVGLF